MSLRFETIALVGRPQTLGLENTLAAMAAWLEAKTHKVVIEESIAESKLLSAWKSLNFAEIAQQGITSKAAPEQIIAVAAIQ